MNMNFQRAMSAIIFEEATKECDKLQSVDLEDLFNPYFNKLGSCFKESLRDDITQS
jgi:hypothetical protein